MKGNDMKMKALLISSLVLVAGVASAQTWQVDRPNKDVVVESAMINSATTLRPISVRDHRNNITFWYRSSSANESITLVFNGYNGQEVATQSVLAGTSYASTTINAPLYFSSVRVSPTTFATTENISVTVVQAPAVGFGR